MTEVEKVTVSTSGDMLAAIPTICGFIPEESVIMLSLQGTQLVSCLRTPVKDAVKGAERMVDVAARDGAEYVILAGVMMTKSYHTLADIMRQVVLPFAARDMEVRGLLILPAFTKGAPWVDLQSNEMGELPDPDMSPLRLVSAAVMGRTVAPSRDALLNTAEQLAPEDEPTGDWGTAFARFVAVVESDDGMVPPGLVADLAVLREHERGARLMLLRLTQTHSKERVASVLAACASRARGEHRAWLCSLASVAYYLLGEGAQAQAWCHASKNVPDTEAPLLSEVIDIAMQNVVHPDVFANALATYPGED